MVLCLQEDRPADYPPIAAGGRAGRGLRFQMSRERPALRKAKARSDFSQVRLYSNSDSVNLPFSAFVFLSFHTVNSRKCST